MTDHRLQRDARAAVRQVVSGTIVSDGVISLFRAAGLPEANVGVLSEEFLERLAALPQRNLALETLHKLLYDQIPARERVNTVQSRSFRESLEAATTRYTSRVISTSQVVEKQIGLARTIREAAHRRGESGLNEAEVEVAFYDALADNTSARGDAGRHAQADRPRTDRPDQGQGILDRTQRETVRAEMRPIVRRLLSKHGYRPHAQEAALSWSFATVR